MMRFSMLLRDLLIQLLLAEIIVRYREKSRLRLLHITSIYALSKWYMKTCQCTKTGFGSPDFVC